MRRDRLLVMFDVVLRIAMTINYATIPFFVAALLFSLPHDGAMMIRLTVKYGANAGAAMAGLRGLMVAALLLVLVVSRLFVALRAIVASVGAGDPFLAENAARLRTIGWALLAIQGADLAYGVSTIWFHARRIDILDWQPSFTGWFGVLIAFILARVFTVGARMRADLDGTV